MLYKILVEYIQNNQEQFYRVAYSYIKSHDDALDIVQDTIYKALKSYKKIKKPEFVKTWFYRILINTSLTYLKKQKKFVDIDTIGETGTIDKEYLDLYDALELLDAEEKTVIILRYFEDLKFQEIADITKSNINTVKTKHARILKHLKTTLDWEVNTIE